MREIIGFLGGTRIDYQGYPSKGGSLGDNLTIAISSMRRAKSRQQRPFNSRWKDSDYLLIKDEKEEKIIKMSTAWQNSI